MLLRSPRRATTNELIMCRSSRLRKRACWIRRESWNDVKVMELTLQASSTPPSDSVSRSFWSSMQFRTVLPMVGSSKHCSPLDFVKPCWINMCIYIYIYTCRTYSIHTYTCFSPYIYISSVALSLLPGTQTCHAVSPFFLIPSSQLRGFRLLSDVSIKGLPRGTQDAWHCWTGVEAASSWLFGCFRVLGFSVLEVSCCRGLWVWLPTSLPHSSMLR